MRAGIALGSNLGDRLELLRSARDRIMKLPGVHDPIHVSPVYETEPVGCEPGANNFLNAVIEVSYDTSARDLLRELRQIEETLGRGPRRTRNASRSIDLDLIYFGDKLSRSPAMRLPHPRATERRFVLQPLSDIRPNLVLAGQTASVTELLANLPEEPRVTRAEPQW